MSKDIFFKNLHHLYLEKRISKKYFDILLDFYQCYFDSVKNFINKKDIENIFITLLELLKNQMQTPYKFPLYHKKIIAPFNYQQFAIDFLNPLVDFQKSKVFGLDNVKKMKEYIEKKENIILLANHQSEVDPFLLYVMLKQDFFNLASNIIFIAGERVITDPLAIPFSMGCNLLCIYSKRYIDLDLTKKHQKQMHNKKVMSIMKDLLSEGGKIIYVAPSGGRDRKDKKGQIQVAPFDPQSLEMLYLMSKKAKKPTHFFPLTLGTYDIFPPPDTIQVEMGEKRIAKRCPVFISFLNEIDMETISDKTETNKRKRRQARARYVHNLVKKEYEQRKL